MVILVLPSPRGHHMLIYYVKKLAGDFCVPGQGPDSVVAAVPIWTPGPNLREPDSPENQDESSNDHSSASATGSSQERKGVIPSRDPPGWLLGDATTEPGPSGACDGFFPAAVMPPPAAEASQVYCLPVVKSETHVQPLRLKPRGWQDGLRLRASRETLLPLLLRGSLGLWDPGPYFPAGCRPRASRSAGGVF